MRVLLQTNMERSAATQRQLDALIHEANALPEGEQVLRKALASASQPNATDTDTAETSGAGSEGTEATLEPPSDVPPKVGAPPAPEHSDGLDDRGGAATLPLTGPLDENKLIATPPHHRSFPGLMRLLRSGSPADHALGPPRPVTRGDPPVHDPTDRLRRAPPPAGPVDVPVRLRTPPCPPPPDPNAVDAAPHGGFARSAGDTSYLSASGPESDTSTTTLPRVPAHPGTMLGEDEERNNDLRQENALRIAAIRLRHTHLLSVRDLIERQGRMQMKLAITAYERSICGSSFVANAKTTDPPSGPKPGQDAERKPDRTHCAGQSARAAPKHDRRHPSATRTTLPTRATASQRSLSPMSAPGRMHAFCGWSQLEAALTQHDQVQSRAVPGARDVSQISPSTSDEDDDEFGDAY